MRFFSLLFLGPLPKKQTNPKKQNNPKQNKRQNKEKTKDKKMDKNPIPPPLPSLPPMDVVISVPKRPERDNGRGRTKSAKEREGISLAKIPPKKPQNRPATVRDVASPRAGSSSSLVSSDQRPPSPLPARARFSDNFAEEKRKKEKKERGRIGKRRGGRKREKKKKMGIWKRS